MMSIPNMVAGERIGLSPSIQWSCPVEVTNDALYRNLQSYRKERLRPVTWFWENFISPVLKLRRFSFLLHGTFGEDNIFSPPIISVSSDQFCKSLASPIGAGK